MTAKMETNSDLFLIIDLNNGGVLCSAPSRQAYCAILRGLPDSAPFSVPRVLRKRSWDSIDFDKDLLLISPVQMEFLPLPDHLQTPEFQIRRDAARRICRQEEILRSYCLAAIDIHCLGPTEHVEHDLHSELRLCNPNENRFTDVLHEYAERMSSNVADVYEELVVKLDTIRLTRIRNLAIYESFLNMILSNPTLSDAKLTEQVRRELLLNSHV